MIRIDKSTQATYDLKKVINKKKQKESDYMWNTRCERYCFKRGLEHSQLNNSQPT